MIKCSVDEARMLTVTEDKFSEIRKKMNSYIRKTYLKAVQAPITEKARLVTWMQLC